MKLRSAVATRYSLIDFGLPSDLEDPENPSWIEVRQSTTGDELYLASLFSESSRVFDDKGNFVEEKREWNGFKVMAIRVYRTLAGAGNIEIEDPTVKDTFIKPFTFAKENGVMRLNMTEDQFMENWNRLPEPVSTAIYNAVITKNEQWSGPK